MYSSATALASERSFALMIMNPPMTSFASANGPSVDLISAPRLRTAAPLDGLSTPSPPRKTPFAFSLSTNSFIRR